MEGVVNLPKRREGGFVKLLICTDKIVHQTSGSRTARGSANIVGKMDGVKMVTGRS